jgi:hypothetical protein
MKRSPRRARLVCRRLHGLSSRAAGKVPGYRRAAACTPCLLKIITASSPGSRPWMRSWTGLVKPKGFLGTRVTESVEAL